ncbi:MAG: HAF repeat-containing protein [Verrucomicrobia bacterium]|nr:MAG: HAF repeat-containing protein [Verrucomicrobiota bacterium]
MVLRECIFVRKEQFAMLPIFLPHLHDTASSYNGTAPTLLRKELPMRTNLSINYESYVRQLVKLAAFILLATPAFAQTYTITDLGTLGGNGNYSVAYCINGSGQVSGASSAPSNQMSDPAFLYSNGQMINIGTLGGESALGRGINTSGQIAGYSTLATGAYHAFLYTGGQMMDIGTLGADYAVAYALNDAGQVVGNSAHLGGQDHAFLYSNGQMTDLGTLGGDTSNAYGINNLGVIAGYSYNASGNFLGFIYQNGTMTPIGTLGGSWSIAYAINDQNQIAGQAYTRGNRAAHAFRLSDGQMVDLGSLGGSSSWGLAINNSGTVVGFATTRRNEYHAFVSTNGARMQDLNKLIPRYTGWILGQANGINDAGQIAGFGTIRGQTHAFLLTPVQ